MTMMSTHGFAVFLLIAFAGTGSLAAQDLIMAKFCGKNPENNKILKTKKECDAYMTINCIPCNANPDGKNCNPWKCDDYTSQEDCEADPHQIGKKESTPCIWGKNYRGEVACDTFQCKHYTSQEECDSAKLVNKRMRDADGVLGLGTFQTCRWLDVRGKMKCEKKQCRDYTTEDECKADANKIVGGCAWAEKYGRTACQALAEETDFEKTAGEPDAQECRVAAPAPAPAPAAKPTTTKTTKTGPTNGGDKKKKADGGDPMGSCDVKAYSDAVTACSEPTPKCVADAGTDVEKICKCGDDNFACLETATKDSKCEEQMKETLAASKKAYEDSKETNDCPEDAQTDAATGLGAPAGGFLLLLLGALIAAADLLLLDFLY